MFLYGNNLQKVSELFNICALFCFVDVRRVPNRHVSSRCSVEAECRLAQSRVLPHNPCQSANEPAETPTSRYNDLIESGTLRKDRHQGAIVDRLQALHDQLKNYEQPIPGEIAVQQQTGFVSHEPCILGLF